MSSLYKDLNLENVLEQSYQLLKEWKLFELKNKSKDEEIITHNVIHNSRTGNKELDTVIEKYSNICFYEAHWCNLNCMFEEYDYEEIDRYYDRRPNANRSKDEKMYKAVINNYYDEFITKDDLLCFVYLSASKKYWDENDEPSEIVDLIYSKDEILKFEGYCKELFNLCFDKSRSALIVSASSRQKYVDDKIKNRNTFFNKTVYVKDNELLSIANKVVNTPSVFFEDVPKEAMSVYIVFNPRNQIMALKNFYSDVITDYMNDNITNIPLNFQSKYVSYLHKQKGEKLFIEIDVDTKDTILLKKFIEKAGNEVIENVHFIVETKNGYHFVYKTDKLPKNLYKVVNDNEFHYNTITRDNKPIRQPYFSIRSDVCFPLPGTYQAGNFPVKLIEKDEFANFKKEI